MLNGHALASAEVLMTTTVRTENLYEQDFSAWAEEQVHLLRHQQFTQLDTAHLIEELEDMRSSTRRELVSRLAVLLAHLLKWQFQPSQRGRSWEVTIQVQRSDIVDLMTDNPSLHSQWGTFIARAWPKARRIAWGETGLDLKTFPAVCPYSSVQLLDETFLPD
jgi:hypothetical protein